MNTFRQARERKGFTQLDVAKHLNLDTSSVCKWETTEILPRAELLPKIAELYGCTIDDLLKPAATAPARQ